MKHSILCALTLVFCLPAAMLNAQDSVPLPVRKVELYKNGMGYFEHVGTVKGQQSVEIVLPSSQLNDVLKSLTVLDQGKGQIRGVTYDSAAPIERRLSELPFNIDPGGGLAAFLNQVRGAAIEIRTPAGIVSGKLMGAELKTKSTGAGTAQEILVSVFIATGEVRIVELESAGALKFIDPGLISDLGRYLDILDTIHQRDVRRLRIQTSGTDERQIFLSYTSESPIWKTTYRIIMDPKQKTLLQGWAIVDNTTPMDWLNVTLSLVAGAPISFIQDLSKPLYARRPVVPLPQGVQAEPQVYESTLEEEAKSEPSPGIAGGVAGRVKALDRPEQMRMETFAPAAAMAAPRPANIADAVRQQAMETAQAQAAGGQQFEYKIRQPVTIRRNESALLPIIQSDVDGEKVSIYRANSGESHPRLAFWLKNVSGLTLDAGPVTIIDANTFAGEGLIESVQPGESRLLSYAVDLGVEVSTQAGSERQRVERVLISQGLLRMYAKILEKRTYKIRNNSETTRSVVLEHPVRPGWKLISTAPAETSANNYRFKIESKPKSTSEFIVQEESPQESSFAVSSITPEQITFWVRERSIDPEIEKALQAIVEKKSEINDFSQKISALDREQNDIFKDQERVRGNLQRLSQGSEEATLRLRYIKQLDAQENRLTAIRTEREKIEAARAASQKQLDALIQKLSLDKNMK
jgi:hypothetical protein